MYGEEKLKIPAGTQTGTVFKLKNRGIRRLPRGGHGDQLVKLQVATPEKLTREQKKLFEQLRDSFNGKKPAGKKP